MRTIRAIVAVASLGSAASALANPAAPTALEPVAGGLASRLAVFQGSLARGKASFASDLTSTLDRSRTEAHEMIDQIVAEGHLQSWLEAMAEKNGAESDFARSLLSADPETARNALHSRLERRLSEVGGQLQATLASEDDARLSASFGLALRDLATEEANLVSNLEDEAPGAAADASFAPDLTDAEAEASPGAPAGAGLSEDAPSDAPQAPGGWDRGEGRGRRDHGGGNGRGGHDGRDGRGGFGGRGGPSHGGRNGGGGFRGHRPDVVTHRPVVVTRPVVVRPVVRPVVVAPPVVRPVVRPVVIAPPVVRPVYPQPNPYVGNPYPTQNHMQRQAMFAQQQAMIARQQQIAYQRQMEHQARMARKQAWIARHRRAMEWNARASHFERYLYTNGARFNRRPFPAGCYYRPDRVEQVVKRGLWGLVTVATTPFALLASMF